LIANHTIVLLTYIAEHPDCHQTYYALGKATGIPPATVWDLINWDHYLAPDHGVPLFFWARKLGYDVEIVGKPGLLLVVVRSPI
jgi:hypothetical protein